MIFFHTLIRTSFARFLTKQIIYENAKFIYPS